MKKIIALILALAMVFALAGCGTEARSETKPAATPEPSPEPTPEPTPEPGFPERMRIGLEEFNHCDSYRTGLSVDFGMSLYVDGEGGDVEMLTTASADMIRDPLLVKSDVKIAMNVLGMKQNTLAVSYIEKKDGKYLLYLSEDDGKSWTTQRVDSLEDALQTAGSAEQMELFLNSAELFEKTGTEQRDGREVDVYSGQLAGDYIAEGIRSSGVTDSLSGLFGTEVSEDMFRDLGALPCVVGIDRETGRIVYYDMDFTDVMQTLMGRVFDKLLEEEFGSHKVQFSVTRELMHIEFSLYNEVGAIEIPAEARGELETAAEPATEEATETAAESPFGKSTVVGSRYENSFLGIGCELDSSWTIADEEELAALMGKAIDNFKDPEKYREVLEAGGAVQEFYASSRGGASINIVYEVLGGANALIDEEQYRDLAVDQLDQLFVEVNYISEATSEKNSVELAGAVRPGILTRAKLSNYDFYVQQIYIKSGSTIAVITFSSLHEEDLAAMAAAFFALEG